MAFDPTLQAQLDKLWFRLPESVPVAEKASRQRWLVREFQICAREANGAKELGANDGPIAADQLRQKPLDQLTQLPAGPAHGVADAATRAAIQAWINARLRCPIIFQARKRIATDPPGEWNTLVQEGFIFHDELQQSAPRVFVRDYTGRHPLRADGTAEVIVVGTALPYANRWGVAALKQHSLDAAITPDRLAGSAWTALQPAQKSTFRIVAALADVEADGNFDGINGYDFARLSAGPFHYTAFPGIAPPPAAPTPTPAPPPLDSELPAFLAYVRAQNGAVFDRLIGRFGIAPTAAWGSGMRNASDRVFRAATGFVDAAGVFGAVADPPERDWIRNWHSFYRIQHAFRKSSEIQRLLWPYSRQRLADLMATPWRGTAPPGAATIGDVFKSERSVAMLARWHVYRPSHIVTGGVVGDVPGKIVAVAGLALKRVTTWTAADEESLANAFITAADGVLADRVTADLRATLARLLVWRRDEWSDGVAGSSLRTARTFVLDASGIPFPAARKRTAPKVGTKRRHTRNPTRSGEMA